MYHKLNYNKKAALQWLNLLGRFLNSAVGVEGLKLLLHPGQRVGQFAVVQDDNGLFDPLEQV